MTMGGNPNPSGGPPDDGGWSERECPVCGAAVRRIPYHLRYGDCPGVES